MSNYLLQIEHEFSQIRGKSSLLSPLDWQLADEWEEKGIPLFIVLKAMAESAKNFNSQKRADTINSLSYFKQSVEKRFKEYASSQIGKPIQVGFDPASSDGDKTVICTVNENGTVTPLENEHIRVLERLADRFNLAYFKEAGIIIPDVLEPAVKAIEKDLREITLEVCENKLTLSEIEEQLSDMAESLVYALAISLTDTERTAMIAEIDTNYPNLDSDGRARMATKRLYEKYRLPELTLFEF